MSKPAAPAPHPRVWPFKTYRGEPYKPPPAPRPPRAPAPAAPAFEAARW